MTQIFCEITTLDLSYVVTVKYTVEISQNFVAFSEYMNFITANSENCSNKILFLYLFQLSSQYKMAEFEILFLVIKECT